MQSTAPIQMIQQMALDFFSKHFALSGHILEIGSDIKCGVALHMAGLGASVTALNPAKNFSPPPEIRALSDDARDLKSVPDGYFDAVISINVFEHIHALHVALNEINRVLRPGGHLGVLFGPLWSSAQGHHLWAKVGDDVVSFWNQEHRNPIDDYSHLLLTPNEMRADLVKKGECHQMIEAIIQAVYMRDDVNRWMHGNYITAFEDMPLDVVVLEPHNRRPIDPVIERKLKERWGNHDFGVTSLRMVARKNHTTTLISPAAVL
jgi:SAM-dependent methyltransferase